MSNHQENNVLKDRNKWVGASDLPAIFNISDFKDQFTLAKEKCFGVPGEVEGNEYAEYGHLMEPKIRAYINGKYNLNFIEDSLKREDLRIRGNVDGIDRDNNIMLEVKTNKGNLTLEQIQPYILQIQLYLYLYDLPLSLIDGGQTT